MALPLLPLLIGGGLLAGQNFFANNAGASNSMLDRVLRIQRPDSSVANVVGQQADLLTDPAAAQLGHAAAGTGSATLLGQAIAAQQSARERQAAEQRRLEEKALTADIRAEDLRRADTRDLAKTYQRLLAPFAEQQQAFSGLRGSLESGTAQDALLSTIQIMKTVDPTSVVRTEEGRAVVAAEGAMKGLANQINKLIGQGWNESTRREWFDAVRRVYAPAQQRAARQIQQLEGEATRRGVDPKALTGLGINREFPGVGAPFTPAVGAPGGGITPEQARERGFVITEE